jgi:hypothetical protein
LAGGDPEEGAEEERLEPDQLTAVEADEKKPEPEAEGLDGPDRRRRTMNQPIAPAITATIAPACSAWTMNG